MVKRHSFDKKRLMYNQAEDLYFITYNIIIILNQLGCVEGKKKFKDYRKLMFLIPINNDENLSRILVDYYMGKNKANKNIINELNKLYYESLETLTLLRYILIILEQKNIIRLEQDVNKTNIILIDKKISYLIAANDLFTEEVNNINEIATEIKTIATINYSTFVDYLFKKNGVVVWEA